MIRDGQVDLQHSHDRANQPFALAQRQSKHRSQCQSPLNGEIGIARLAARRGSGLRLPTSQRFVGEPNREASTIAKRGVIVTPVRHSMPLTWNVASALGMEFERHDRSSRWQRRLSVPKLLKRPPRPYPCTKVARYRRQRLLRQHRLGVVTHGGPETYGLSVGAALRRTLAEGVGANGGRRRRRANGGNPTRRGCKPRLGESFPALCLRYVDEAELPRHPLREVRG